MGYLIMVKVRPASYVDMNAPRLGSFSVNAGHDKTMSLENSGDDTMAYEKQYKVSRAF